MPSVVYCSSTQPSIASCARFRQRGAVGQLALDPDAGVLYDAAHRVGEETGLALEERKASTGRLVTRSTEIQNYLAINGLATVPHNVWAAYPTGMVGVASRFTRDGLVEHRPREGEAVRSNAIEVFTTPGILWIDGVGGVYCADPLTGVSHGLLADTAMNSSGAVAGLAGRVYRVIGHRLELLLPGSACRG